MTIDGPLSHREEILRAIDVERRRQDEKWGHEFDDKNTPNDWVSCMTIYLGKAVKTPRDRHDHDIVIDTFRKNMVRAVAIGVAAMET